MSFIRNCWYVASWAHALTATEPMGVTILDERLVLFRTAGGSPAALRDCCCHRNAPLSLGRCEHGLLRCMYHGLLFEGSGRCVRIPGQQHIPSACRVRPYPVVESHGWIWVWMGDPTQADPRRIPVPHDYDLRNWDMRSSQCDVEAHYLLMNDNLADMSHVAFLHEGTFGGGDTRIAESHPRITRLERGMRVERWLADRTKMEGWLPEDPGVPAGRAQDLWLEYDWLAPGIFIMRTEIHRAGVAQSSAYHRPKEEPVHANLNVQAVTPTGQTSLRHFFALGPPRTETVNNPALADEMFQIMLSGFQEDRRMLEAQQRNLMHWPIEPAAAIKHDRGVLLVRQIIESMIQGERDAESLGKSLAEQKPLGGTTAPRSHTTEVA